MELSIIKIHRIIYPHFFNEVAAYLGKLRDLYNYDMNESNDRFKRGERSEFVNILGIKGELIFAYYLFTKGKKYQMNKILDSRPIQSYDITVEGEDAISYLDVKTIRSDAPDLLVNEEAHKKSKGITDYAFLQITGLNTARAWICNISEVSTWKIKNVKYSNAYFKTITEIETNEKE